MLRRNTRLRKEYLYRKSLEGKEKEKYEKKRKLRKALEEGKTIPTELREEEPELREEIEAEDKLTAAPRSIQDDEYERAGIEDPRILLTTSRDPSARLVQFAKEMSLVIPNTQRKNRGKHVVKELVDACRGNDITDLIILYETRGEPDTMIISHMPFGPTAFFALSDCVMRHDIKEKETMSLAFPHLIFHGFTTKLGERTQNILKYIFPVPKPESKRVVTFSNESDFIHFRHHMYEKSGKEVILKEIGPRFQLKLFQIRLGTIDMTEADNEWVFRSFINSAKRKNYLQTLIYTQLL